MKCNSSSRHLNSVSQKLIKMQEPGQIKAFTSALKKVALISQMGGCHKTYQ